MAMDAILLVDAATDARPSREDYRPATDAQPAREIISSFVNTIIIAHVHRLADHATVIEFSAARPERATAAGDDGGADGPYPLAWFSFAPLGSASLASSTERGELKCTLRAPRALRSLVLMLISAEDRMFFMHDEHADPNIDLEFCGLSGHIVNDNPNALVALLAALEKRL